MRGTLSELEAKLDEAFVRVGRSYLVNLNYVRRIGKTELILNTGEKLLVPRGSYKKLNEAFIKYFYISRKALPGKQAAATFSAEPGYATFYNFIK